MKNFEYAQPRTIPEVLELLPAHTGGAAEWRADTTALLAGGTDLVGLMKKMIVTPDRVVNVSDVEEMQGIRRDEANGRIIIGTAVHLDQLLDSPVLDSLQALKQAIAGLSSMQYQAQSTLGGELCRRPRCWYFRDGRGLLAGNGKLVAEGDNRYHAIMGNSGPARFVNASRLAPSLIALGAQAVIAGPESTDRREIPLEQLYQTPRREGQRENVLTPNQVLTQLVLPIDTEVSSAAYEVRHGAGPDDPLAAAASALWISGSVVRDARIVLGHVAPTPWVSSAASAVLMGRPVSAKVAEAAGHAAVAAATPLSNNEYKVQLARVSVTRSILQAANLPTGGLQV